MLMFITSSFLTFLRNEYIFFTQILIHSLIPKVYTIVLPFLHYRLGDALLYREDGILIWSKYPLRRLHEHCQSIGLFLIQLAQSNQQ